MFGIGFPELILVLVVALLVLGPDKLPEVAKTMAKAYNELRRTGLDVKRTIEGTVKDMDISTSVRDGFKAAEKTVKDNIKDETVSEAGPESDTKDTSRKAT
jgi:Tat protein translocase TatB subunit